MSGYQVIARKYRPTAFEEVVGQEAVARTLMNAIRQGRIAHAYMFCGPRGTGKTSTARILARALNCLSSEGPTTEPCGACDLCVRATQGDDLDVLEIDAASNRKVDDARTLIANVSFHPTRARFKVYVVDEVHMLTTEAFNALLKTLEEPPPHVKFIFATTDPQKVPATILSRCQRFDFRPVPPARIVELLGSICGKEGLRAEPEALTAIAAASVGGMRDAQSLLEQLATLGGGEVRVSDLHALLGTVPSERMRLLFAAIASGDASATLACAGEILDTGTDPGELLRQGMRHVHDLLLLRVGGPRAEHVAVDPAQREALAEQAQSFSHATLVYAVTLLSEALRNARLLGEGRLFAETAFARLAGHGDMRFLDQLVRDVSALEKRIGAAPTGGSGPTVRERPGADPSPEGAPPPRRPAPPAPDRPQGEPRGAQGSVEPIAGRAGGSGGDDVPGPSADIGSLWGEVLAKVRSNSRLRTALHVARVMDSEGGRVVLGFPPSSAFLRRSLEAEDMRQALEAAVEQVAGRRMAVVTVDREEDRAPEEESAPAPQRDLERLTAAEVEAVRQAPLTKRIEGELGGRIVHVRRQS